MSFDKYLQIVLTYDRKLHPLLFVAQEDHLPALWAGMHSESTSELLFSLSQCCTQDVTLTARAPGFFNTVVKGLKTSSACLLRNTTAACTTTAPRILCRAG